MPEVVLKKNKLQRHNKTKKNPYFVSSLKIEEQEV